MKIKPLFDNIVVKEIKEEQKTESGLFLPSSSSEKPSIAEVIEVGEGGKVDGNEIEIKVKKGDKVLFSKYAGSEYKIENETYIVIKQSDILAIIE